GALYYSREIPSLLKGMRQSKIFGRHGIITFESNGLFIVARGRGVPRFVGPGVTDFRGYRAMYRDFLRAIATGAPPEMSLERAMDDQRLMDQVYESLSRPATPSTSSTSSSSGAAPAAARSRTRWPRPARGYSSSSAGT